MLELFVGKVCEIRHNTRKGEKVITGKIEGIAHHPTDGRPMVQVEGVETSPHAHTVTTVRTI